jgi:hypothetical protein
MMMGD